MGLARLGPMFALLAGLGACAAPVSTEMSAPSIGRDQRIIGALSGASVTGDFSRSDFTAVGVLNDRAGPHRTAASTGTGPELAFVTGILRDLQIQSFAANAEFCGYIGLDPGGNLMSSPINQGDEASCPLPIVPPQMTMLASFHTHGTYSPYYASEFPTTTDMLTDAADNIDGYISTPGGRLWYVDTDTMTARQLCGRGCLPQDPNYVADDDGPVRQMFTLADLAAFERS